jgi:DNA-binding transcriptional ArsR family regulator
MGNNYIAIDLNDSRSDKIAEVISNKTCKRILNLIAEGEMSESEIAGELELPINTVGYNIKNLASAGLIETTKNVLWSVKGKRVLKYKVSNKKIIISPKSMFKGILPGLLVLAGATYLVKMATTNIYIASESKTVELASSGVQASSGVAMDAINVAHNLTVNGGVMSAPVWMWFAFGGLVAMLIYYILKMIDERGWANG